MSAREDAIFKIIEYSPVPLAIHEIKEDKRMADYSECSISARLREPYLSSRLFKRTRPGKNYDEWSTKVLTDEQKKEELLKSGLLL